MQTMHRFFSQYAVALSFIFLIALLSSCNKALTREDVDKKIQTARNATKDAEKKSKEAIEARQKFYTDLRDTQVGELEARISEIDKRIRDLERTANKSGNDSASSNIASAVEELQYEKEELSAKVNEVNAVEIEDWSSAYGEIDDAIAQIEEEINRLADSLSDN